MKFNLPIALLGKFQRNKDWRTSLESFLQSHDFNIRHFELTSLSPQEQSPNCAYILGPENEIEIEDAVHFINHVRERNESVPIFLYLGAAQKLIPPEALQQVKARTFAQNEKPRVAAQQIAEEAKRYIEGLTPPFFKALLKYAASGAQSWHCPGHSGGVAFLKSPQGQIFHQYFGENMLRADICNAVEDLGQLLEHTGAAAEAEQNAARIFGADHLFFVTNGTSTSNKIVWHSLVGPDDIVIVDRNCHKSNLHGIMMTGAIPVFLNPTRNHHGIIGPIPASEFTMESIQKKIDAHPLIKDKKKRPRLLTLTQSTYDGILYNVEYIQRQLDGKIDAFLFDEAWLPHATFHPLYKNMHAIDQSRKRTHSSMLYSTQSTHKTLAGLSQASQILVRESDSKKLNRAVFNEAYLMHTSTSPQYSIIASCDVAAAMMEGAGGRSLVQDSLDEALEFRSQMHGPENQTTQIGGWFRIWGPQHQQFSSKDQSQWLLSTHQSWHGFGEVQSNFNMLDPIKLTVLTPGLNDDGTFGTAGVPASIVAKFLRENGVIVEKYGLYSFFIMFTIGVTKGRWRSLVSALEKFKKAYDNNEPLTQVMPRFSQSHPSYATMGLQELCTKIHKFYCHYDVAKMTTQTYLSKAEIALKPSISFAKTAHEEIDRVCIDDLENRITAVLLTPYPPGIPLLMPGERFNSAIVNYLKFTAEFNHTFPQLESDVHGLVSKLINGKKKYFVDCVKEEKS